MIEANAKVAQSLFQMATQGKNVAAAIFWMKARGRWREVQPTPEAGSAMQVTMRHFNDDGTIGPAHRGRRPIRNRSWFNTDQRPLIGGRQTLAGGNCAS